MFYKLLDESGDYVDKTTGDIKNLLEANVAHTPQGTNISWLEFSTKGQALDYFNIELATTPETPGDYLIGKQSDWLTFAAKTGFTVKNLMDKAKRSINKVGGEWLWMVELWDLTFSEMLWAWGNRMILLKEYQALQLGRDVKLIEDANGERLLDNSYNIVSGKEDEIITWCRIFEPTMPFGLSQSEELTYITDNNVKNKIKILFDAFKIT